MISRRYEHIVMNFYLLYTYQISSIAMYFHCSDIGAKRSTETHLIQTVHDISKYLDEKKSVDMAILDFTNAFDKVPHKRLIHKLKYYGITEPISSWIYKASLQKELNRL